MKPRKRYTPQAKKYMYTPQAKKYMNLRDVLRDVPSEGGASSKAASLAEMLTEHRMGCRYSTARPSQPLLCGSHIPRWVLVLRG